MAPGSDSPPRSEAKLSSEEAVADWVAEFRRRVAYIEQNYRRTIHFIGGSKERNAGLNQIKLAQNGKLKARPSRTRLNAAVETSLSELARAVAIARTGQSEPKVEPEDVEKAIEEMAELKVKRGAPAADVLRHHVEGLVVLIEQMSGRPVIAHNYRGTNNYDRHFEPGLSEIVPTVFRRIDPSISVGKLVELVLKAKRSGSLRGKGFGDYFPFYGAQIDADGEIKLGFGYQLKSFTPNIPIYFPRESSSSG